MPETDLVLVPVHVTGWLIGLIWLFATRSCTCWIVTAPAGSAAPESFASVRCSPARRSPDAATASPAGCLSASRAPSRASERPSTSSQAASGSTRAAPERTMPQSQCSQCSDVLAVELPVVAAVAIARRSASAIVSVTVPVPEHEHVTRERVPVPALVPVLPAPVRLGPAPAPVPGWIERACPAMRALLDHSLQAGLRPDRRIAVEAAVEVE